MLLILLYHVYAVAFIYSFKRLKRCWRIPSRQCKFPWNQYPLRLLDFIDTTKWSSLAKRDLWTIIGDKNYDFPNWYTVIDWLFTLSILFNNIANKTMTISLRNKCICLIWTKTFVKYSLCVQEFWADQMRLYVVHFLFVLVSYKLIHVVVRGSIFWKQELFFNYQKHPF